MTNNDYNIDLKPEFVAPQENKEKTELGMNEWHGTRYTVKKQLCFSFLKNQECNNKKCEKYHNLQEYLKVKDAPLAGSCPIQSEHGFCTYKWNCKFQHSEQDYQQEHQQIITYLNDIGYKDIKNFNFDQVIKPNFEHRKFDPSNKLFLAPMCTVGTLPFRRFCKHFGCDVTCSEMIFARDLLNTNSMEMCKLRRHPSEDIYGIQLTGCYSELAAATKLITQLCQFDYIDLNAACPQDIATQRKCGFMIAQKGQIRNCLDAMGETCKLFDINLSCKTRIGDLYGESRIDDLLNKDFNVSKLDFVTIHGRTAKQRYTKTANYEQLAILSCKLKEKYPNLVFVANGDLYQNDIYQQHKKSTMANSFMIGRGALQKPWIFTEFKENRVMDPSSSQRIEWLKLFANYCIDYFGSDNMGIERARNQFLENYNYMCRYVPVGILQSQQLLNHRWKPYVGRDDMETLLGSQNVEDWVKISEMFFGRIPDDFQYQNKHKSKGQTGASGDAKTDEKHENQGEVQAVQQE